MSTPIPRSHDYELGHSEWELARLASQAQLVDPITRDYFKRAGISHAMRILDIGSGAGDVAFLAADLVGSGGEVVGTDRSPTAVAAATDRARQRGLSNVSFVHGDPCELNFDKPFDAIVGRYVLMFCPDPTAMVKTIVKHLSPERGIVVFHEVDWRGTQSLPPSPTYDRCCGWIVETFAKVGTHVHMGTALYQAFLGAGLPAPTMGIQAIVGGKDSDHNGADLIANLAITMAPVMEEHGVTTIDNLAPATLQARMLAEMDANASVIIGRFEVGAWAHLG
jgi:ubiquinone/menaquinone biosynthesis C-methylase UbiE